LGNAGGGANARRGQPPQCTAAPRRAGGGGGGGEARGGELIRVASILELLSYAAAAGARVATPRCSPLASKGGDTGEGDHRRRGGGHGGGGSAAAHPPHRTLGRGPAPPPRGEPRVEHTRQKGVRYTVAGANHFDCGRGAQLLMQSSTPALNGSRYESPPSVKEGGFGVGRNANTHPPPPLEVVVERGCTPPARGSIHTSWSVSLTAPFFFFWPRMLGE
jgi:hypothetical protein